MIKSSHPQADIERLSAGSMIESISTGIAFIIVKKWVILSKKRKILNKRGTRTIKRDRYKFKLICVQDGKGMVIRDVALMARYKVIYYHDKKEGEG